MPVELEWRNVRLEACFGELGNPGTSFSKEQADGLEASARADRRTHTVVALEGHRHGDKELD